MNGEAPSMILALDTAWWLVFITAVGLCIGSFLNVVVYRLPLGLSVNRPVGSHCPACGAAIRWYDNIPLVSYMMLRGRCRDCRHIISVRYPVMELLCAFVTLLLLDAFFVADFRVGLLNNREGLSWSVFSDWPILLAHLILFASLLALSAIDLEYYWVDIRATHFAAAAGFVLHALWTPRVTPIGWPRPGDGLALAALGALLGLGIVYGMSRWLDRRSSREDHDAPVADEEAPPLDSVYLLDESNGLPNRVRSNMILPAILTGVLLLTGVSAFSEGVGLGNWLPFVFRAGIILSLFFAVLVGQSTVRRDSDQEIIEAIHAERVSARWVSLEELAVFAPVLLCGLLAAAVYLSGGTWADQLRTVLHWSPTGRSWQPLWGLGTAAAGYVVGGAIGWAVRIGFTLLFGKEALGTGDIHILAAAGCVAGWQVACGGFVLACLLALAAMILVLPFKRSRAIPLGPWLSLAFLILVVFYDPVAKSSTVGGLKQMVDLFFSRP